MIAEWMVYCTLSALGLSLAAVLAERALLAGRGPVRLVWIGAVALSVLVPAVAYRIGSRPVTTERAPLVPDAVVQGPVNQRVAPIAAANVVNESPLPPARDWRATLSRFDEPLAIAWLTLSLALALKFIGGIVMLAWMRRRWQRRTVRGVSVFVSERTGPAVVGVVAPAIVVPEWVLALEPDQIGLLLRHEEEHRRTGDGRLLTAAELALIAMPWNVALWWQIVRLRVAVELDCDARVLQNADPRSYGDLLLEVARPRRGPSLLGATAFAEKATQLERRIRMLARHRARTSRAARVLATCIGVAAVTVAWAAPRPPVPTRATVSSPPTLEPVTVHRPAPPPSDLTLSTDQGTQTPSVSETPVSSDAARVEPAAALVLLGPEIVPVPSVQPFTAVCADRGAPAFADEMFEFLFAGMTLTQEQANQACDLLNAQVQRILQGLFRPGGVLTPQQLARAKRDQELRALLTNDADRATFDARIAQTQGGRGRGGGDGVTFNPNFVRDTTATARSGGGGARGGGGGARSGGGGGGGRGARGGGGGEVDVQRMDSLMIAVTNLANAETFRRLFQGITLTPEQEATAKAVIASTNSGRRVERVGSVELHLDKTATTVMLQEDILEGLIQLFPSDADRKKLAARVVSVPR